MTTLYLHLLRPILSPKKNWYDLRYNLSYIKSYIKLCKKILGKSNFPRGVLHNLRYNFEIQFGGCLECTPSDPLPPPPEAVNHQRACTVHPPPLVVPSAAIALRCVLHPAPLVVLSAARSPRRCQPPPPLPRASTPPLSLCCPPPTCFSI